MAAARPTRRYKQKENNARESNSRLRKFDSKPCTALQNEADSRRAEAKNSLKTRIPEAAAVLFLHSSSANAEPVNAVAGLLACSAEWAAFPFRKLVFKWKTSREQWRVGPTPM